MNVQIVYCDVMIVFVPLCFIPSVGRPTANVSILFTAINNESVMDIVLLNILTDLQDQGILDIYLVWDTYTAS